MISKIEPSPFVVIYDGSCGICRKIINKLQKIEYSANISYVPSSKIETIKIPLAEEIKILAAKYMICYEVSKDQVHLGYFAFRRILLLSRKFKIFAMIMFFPGTSLVGRFIYRFVASNRKRMSGKGSSCGL
jgi:predicted DCC family thiol-disulfide oxidoreductase YuxK